MIDEKRIADLRAKWLAEDKDLEPAEPKPDLGEDNFGFRYDLAREGHKEARLCR